MRYIIECNNDWWVFRSREVAEEAAKALVGDCYYRIIEVEEVKEERPLEFRDFYRIEEYIFIKG